MASVHLRRYLAATEWLSGPAWAVRTPFDKQFVDALKAHIPPRSREWVKLDRGGVWVVEDAKKGALKTLLVEYFGAHEICTRCAMGTPCWVWRELDRDLGPRGFKGASFANGSDVGGGSQTPPHTEARDAPPPRAKAAGDNVGEKREGKTWRGKDARGRSSVDFDEWFRTYFGGAPPRPDTEEPNQPPPARRSNVLTLREAAELLGVPKNASVADVKKAYARAAMQHHPDRGGDHEKMVEVNKAKETFEAHFARMGARA